MLCLRGRSPGARTAPVHCPNFEPLESRVLLNGGSGALLLVGAATYADPGLTTPGLVGSYIDATLNHLTGAEDWRVTQEVAGSRLDEALEFLTDA